MKACISQKTQKRGAAENKRKVAFTKASPNTKPLAPRFFEANAAAFARRACDGENTDGVSAKIPSAAKSHKKARRNGTKSRLYRKHAGDLLPQDGMFFSKI